MKKVVKINHDSRTKHGTGYGYVDFVMRYDNGTEMSVTMSADEFAAFETRQEIETKIRSGKFNPDEIMKLIEDLEQKAYHRGSLDEAESNAGAEL